MEKTNPIVLSINPEENIEITTLVNIVPYEKQELLYKLENRLNFELGFEWWKWYVAGAVWSNVATPINLTVTVLTALTTMQATTNEPVIEHATFVRISIVTLILTTLNTFFRPHEQMLQCMELLHEWNKLGNRFEQIFYTTEPTSQIRFESYRSLHTDIQILEDQHGPEKRNFFTDLIHIIARLTVLRKRDRWLDIDESTRNL
jgi:hypothetical protein